MRNIKKVVYFIPAIIGCLFYGIASTAGSLEPIAYVFCALLIISGVILSFNKWWGSIPGIIMGTWLMTLDLKETGQIIVQWPIGLIFVIYFIICIVSILHKKR